jgi:hypothetical protein
MANGVGRPIPSGKQPTKRYRPTQEKNKKDHHKRKLFLKNQSQLSTLND